MIQANNEQEAIDVIKDGLPEIWGIRPDLYIVQHRGQGGKFTSALEAINFYNSTFNESI